MRQKTKKAKQHRVSKVAHAVAPFTKADNAGNTFSERVSQAIKNAPDFSQLDDTGFLRDMWEGIKTDVPRIWRDKAPASGT